MNDFLVLSGIPPEVFKSRLGNRQALEWVIDQHQVSTDKRSGITNDPNRADDPQYIVRLIGQVVTTVLLGELVQKTFLRTIGYFTFLRTAGYFTFLRTAA